MEILNAQEHHYHFRNQIEQYLEKANSESDYYDEDIDYSLVDFYDYLFYEATNYENIDFVMQDKHLTGVLLKQHTEGLDFIKLIGNFDDKIYLKLKNKYPDSIIYIDGYTSDKPFEYYNLATTKATNGIEDYMTPGFTSFLVPKHLSETIIRDKIEELIIPEFKEEDLIFEDKTGNEILEELLEKYDKNQFFTGFSRGESGHRHVAGFHYFGLDESDMRQPILTCKLNGEIIGVVKHGLYEGYGHIPHQGLAYIDVNINYRNRGIAKLLIKELNNHLDKTLPLFLTRESELGELCHMEKLFLENIHTTDCVSYDKQEEYYIKNKDRIPQLKNYYKKITGQELER